MTVFKICAAPFECRLTAFWMIQTAAHSPGMWTLLRAISFSMMMGAQQPASVKTMKKNLMTNSKSPTEEIGVAWRVFQMLTNIHVYRTAMSTSL